MPQVELLNLAELREGVVLVGKGDGHVLSLSPYPHDGVNMIVHYRWLAPEY